MNALISVSGQLQPAVQTTARASSDVSHASSQSERLALVLLWADVKHHLGLKTSCTDMFWQMHTFFFNVLLELKNFSSIPPTYNIASFPSIYMHSR